MNEIDRILNFLLGEDGDFYIPTIDAEKVSGVKRETMNKKPIQRVPDTSHGKKGRKKKYSIKDAMRFKIQKKGIEGLLKILQGEESHNL